MDNTCFFNCWNKCKAHRLILYRIKSRGNSVLLRMGEVSEQEVLRRTNRLHSFDKTWTAQKTTPPTILQSLRNVFTELLPSNDREIHTQTQASKNSSVVACIRCSGNVFTEPLPSNERMDTNTYTDWWEGFMMGSVAMIYNIYQVS
jgi:hypothetical protein